MPGPTWSTPFWLQGSCLASAPHRHGTVDTSTQGGHSPSWQAAGQVWPQGSTAPHTPPQLNSCRPQRLSVTTAPQKHEADTTRGQGGQGPALGQGQAASTSGRPAGMSPTPPGKPQQRGSIACWLCCSPG